MFFHLLKVIFIITHHDMITNSLDMDQAEMKFKRVKLILVNILQKLPPAHAGSTMPCRTSL